MSPARKPQKLFHKGSTSFLRTVSPNRGNQHGVLRKYAAAFDNRNQDQSKIGQIASGLKQIHNNG